MHSFSYYWFSLPLVAPRISDLRWVRHCYHRCHAAAIAGCPISCLSPSCYWHCLVCARLSLAGHRRPTRTSPEFQLEVSTHALSSNRTLNLAALFSTPVGSTTLCFVSQMSPKFRMVLNKMTWMHFRYHKYAAGCLNIFVDVKEPLRYRRNWRRYLRNLPQWQAQLLSPHSCLCSHFYYVKTEYGKDMFIMSNIVCVH